jgi:hypothetical protein
MTELTQTPLFFCTIFTATEKLLQLMSMDLNGCGLNMFYLIYDIYNISSLVFGRTKSSYCALKVTLAMLTFMR